MDGTPLAFRQPAYVYPVNKAFKISLCILCGAAFATLLFATCNKQLGMSAILAITSMQPIEFYGRVVDQNGKPVPNAKVRGSAEIVRYWMDQKWRENFTTSDSDGYFHFSGLHGQSLVVSPSKEGYESNYSSMSFAYSSLTPEKERHKPDREMPVIFTMWKQQGPELLIKGDKFFGIKGDGTPFTIDLAKGRKSEGRGTDGDLLVSISQPPRIESGKPFDWSFRIEAIAGGLVEPTQKQYLNEAPDEGYQPDFSKELKATDHEWSEVVRKTFYVKSRNGTQFASMVVEIHANYQGAAVFSLHYFVNPKHGSRNLEYDPSKQAALP